LRVRSLLTAALITGGLFAAGASPAVASPIHTTQAESCALTVSDFYMSIGMQTATARLSGGCTATIDIAMEQSSSPDGPFYQVDTLDYLQQSSDGTAATGYFRDPEERGYCRARATASGLTAYSAHAVSC